MSKLTENMLRLQYESFRKYVDFIEKELEILRTKLEKAEALALSAEFAIEHQDLYGLVFTPWENDLSKSLKEYRGETK